MGATSALMLLDVHAVRQRVLPAIRHWADGGEPAPWWAEAMRSAGRPDPDPVDRGAWPAVPLPPGRGTPPNASTRQLVPLPDRQLQEETRGAVEIALLTATVGDGLAFGNARWLALDLVDEDDPVLEPPPVAGSTLAAFVGALDENLMHVNAGGGGYGEGLRGALDDLAVAQLDDELTGRGSQPTEGSVRAIRTAIDTARLAQRSHDTLVALHSMARLARRQGAGLLHGRDLSTRHIGVWRAGIFHRHA